MVGVTGFEPATFSSRTRRATKLRYTPTDGANEGARTPDLQFTKLLLYRLSYIGPVHIRFIVRAKHESLIDLPDTVKYVITFFVSCPVFL